MSTSFAAPRDFSDYTAMCDAVRKSRIHITGIVTGSGPAGDALSLRWAMEHNVPVKAAESLLDGSALSLVAIWNGECAETANLIKDARAKGLAVYVHLV